MTGEAADQKPLEERVAEALAFAREREAHWKAEMAGAEPVAGVYAAINQTSYSAVRETLELIVGVGPEAD